MNMTMPPFTYVRPKSLEETFRHLSTGNARIQAGGTDLLGCLHDGVFAAEKVISISRLDELQGIGQVSNGSLKIGALATVSDVANHPLLKECYPALVQAAGEVASPQLRNQGTIGGNLCQKPRCWYYRGDFHCTRKGGNRCFAFAGENQYHCIFGGVACYIVHPSDTAPALSALQAIVRITGPKGQRSVPIDQFFVAPAKDPRRETILEPEEIVTEISLPAPPAGLRSSYRKVRARRSWDFALAGVALALRFDGTSVSEARVYLSGAAPVPWRSKEVEQEITGKQLDGQTIARAAEAVVKNAEPLAKNGYKVPLFRAVIEEELQAMAQA
jgi:xanthine dehydrogenase YagS FAD-binding subunit